MDWIKAHYDRAALIAAGLFLFISAISIWWNAIQFANRLIAQQAPSPKNASSPATAIELDRAAEQLQHPAQWKSTGRSGLFVPERHFIAANGLPGTLQNTQVHAPVPNEWFEQYALPVEDADALDQDPDGDGFTNLDEWQGGTNPIDKNSHPIISQNYIWYRPPRNPSHSCFHHGSAANLHSTQSIRASRRNSSKSE